MMTLSLLQEESRVFRNADPYRVSEYVNSHVGPHRIHLTTKQRSHAGLSHRAYGDLDLCALSYGCRVQVTCPALERFYHLQVLRAGRCLWRSRGEEYVFRPGELLLINPDDPVELTYSDDCEKFILKLPVHWVDAACERRQWKRSGEFIRFGSRHQLERYRCLPRLLELLCLEAEDEQADAASSQQHYARIIAEKLLLNVSNDAVRTPDKEVSPLFERIVHYIDEHVQQNIRPEQLARLSHISERSLYALFERNVATTPKHYIRERKLERIHAALRNPASGVRNVTEIALDYGFTHLGRFSECYRQKFGELPSETLRKR